MEVAQYTMTKRWDVAVAGEVFVDHVFSGFTNWPSPGEEHFTDHYVREVGGGAAITSCALARLGRSVAIFAIAGKEDEWARTRLQSFGVLLEALRFSDCPTAVSVSISTREDRSFLTWPGANRELKAYLSERATWTRLAEARHVHLAMPIDRGLAHELLPYLRAAACSISLDVGYQTQWLLNSENEATCREANFFFPNEIEGRIITGHADPEKVLRSLAARNISGAVLKLGAAGAAAISAGKICRQQPPQVDVVDTTGAGDAFDAGFIDALLDGASLSERLRKGCLCGAASTRSAGALASLPSRDELLRLESRERP